MAALRACLPANTVLYNEAITATGDALRTIPLEQPGSLFGNHGGGLGKVCQGRWGQVGASDQRVVALVGDGSSMYSVQSFWPAAHHNIPVVYIILSNRTYRILKLNMNR
jgi:benzoylformate decarboxylase